jgi:hypothetical protein
MPAAACTFWLADRGDDVAGREPALRDLLRVEPDAHRVVARAEQLHVADALTRARRSLTLSTA